jgi:uncharacterized membrane protein
MAATMAEQQGRIGRTLRWVLSEFGPLIGFWVLAAAFGTKAAIAGSIGIIIGDSAWRYRRGIAFTRLYLLTSGLTLVFGAVDLLSADPFMLKYEAVITNLASAAMFAAGARGARPLIQELAEQRQGTAFPARADVRRFFQLFTLLWAGYFVAKAGLYFWFAWTLTLLQAAALRGIVGPASFAVIMALSVTQGRRLFALCRALGWLPAVDDA